MEDFVTFEIAKKLNEKGFREKCLTYYDVDDNVGLLYNTQYSNEMLPCQYTDLLMSHNTSEGRQPDDSDNCVDTPTISQVLKWMREEKKLYLCPCVITDYDDDFGPHYTWWSFIVVNIESGDSICRDYEHVVDNRYKSFEQAALAGIEYVLDNFI